MILRTRYGGDRELRSAWPDNTRPPARLPAYSASGLTVSTDSAFGLPAFGAALRLVSGVVAATMLSVFEGRRGDKRERADVWQAGLLEQPVLGDAGSDFDWRWDVAASLEACENAVLQKIKRRGRVVELRPVPMEYVQIRVDRKTGAKLFDVGTASSYDTFTTDDMLHIRGATVTGGAVGVSRIHQHRDPIGAMLAAQKFEGSYFRNHARPDIAIVYPAGSNMTKDQHDLWMEEWAQRYGGPDNAGKPFGAAGGADIKPIPLSLRDAQFIETRQLGVAEIGRIMDVDPALLAGTDDADARAAALNVFLRVQLPPRLRRIERALKADTDLFGETPLYPEFLVDDLLFADPVTRANVQHKRIQAGIELVDEARADNGRPPLPDGAGQIPQITPVGGAPNPDPLPTGDDDDARTFRAVVPVELHQAPMTVVLPAPEVQVTNEVRAADQPAPVVNITNEVQPTPVTIENDVDVQVPETPVSVQTDVHVPETPVEVTNVIEQPPSRRRVTFEKDARGGLKGAEITDG